MGLWRRLWCDVGVKGLLLVVFRLRKIVDWKIFVSR